jgi:carboxylesterase type B
MELLSSTKTLFPNWHRGMPEFEPKLGYLGPKWDPESADPFTPLHPCDAMEKGKINKANLMLGYAEKEGVWAASGFLPRNQPDEKKLWKEFVHELDVDLSYTLGL